MSKLTVQRPLDCLVAAVILALFSTSSASVSAVPTVPTALLPPRPEREFRGAWIATVGNIDWPSQPGLPSSQQKAELLSIVENASKLKLNALIFQVRPSCDAFYSSKLEPWSEYLTGIMGKPSEPNFDPLEFLIEQAHQKGLELHAWFNPFRARHLSSKSPASTNHISRTHPSVVRSYGKYLWLDPGERFAQQHTKSVILDVVRRYDLDGVHLDDYFYPYPEKDSSGKFAEFPDEASWKRYRANSGKLSRADWRRKNVDDFVQSLYQEIKSAKPWVKFGISPFGIWRPGYPQQVTGLDAFEAIYADSQKWLVNGWVDYFAPQLYWAVKPPDQSYPSLLKWWAAQNTCSRHLWPGNNLAKVGTEWRPEEILNQVRLTRKQPGASGNIYWSISSLIRNRDGLSNALIKGPYLNRALVPASSWLDKQPPEKPRIAVEQDTSARAIKVSWQGTGPEPAWLWILQTRTGDQWKTEILPAKELSRRFPMGDRKASPTLIALTAVDRCSNVSPIALYDARTQGLANPAPASQSR